MVVIGQPVARRKKRPILLWIFFAMLALIVLLMLVNLAASVIAFLLRPAMVPAGDVAYATTFDQYNADWSQEPGQASTEIRDGALWITIGDLSGIYSVLRHDFVNVEARVAATWVTANSEYDELGLLFRLKDKQHYYLFKVRGDGAYRVEKASGGVSVISEWQISPAVRTGIGATNVLQVTAVGATMRVAANGVPLPLCLKGADRRSTWNGLASGTCMSNGGQLSDSFTDAEFEFGKVGLAVDADAPGVQVAFDNVIVVGAE